MNCKMPELKRCFERAGFKNVKTVLSSGNVVFEARTGSNSALEKKIEAALKRDLKTFLTIVRSVDSLREILEADPYKNLGLKPETKKVVTFFKNKPESSLKSPIEKEGARLVTVKGAELYSYYLPGPQGPVFMQLIEKTFGKDLTTRTWDTVKKVSR